MVDTSSLDALTEWRHAVTLARLVTARGASLRGATVLDVGAYPGDLTHRLRQAQAEVIAVTLVTDIAFETRMRERGVGVFICDVQASPLPVANASVDVALCCEVIEHLDGDVRRVLAETRRAVRSDGMLLLTTPNHASMANRWSLARGRSVFPPVDHAEYPFYRGAGVPNPMRHVREFTVEEISALLHGAGFTRVTLETASPPLRRDRVLSWRGRAITRLLRWSERLSGAGGELIIAVARP
jgi:2-polyprenyl-3-methyl-5-hydroxy-6-metoxy-1,4-benzoquinol methylase